MITLKQAKATSKAEFYTLSDEKSGGSAFIRPFSINAVTRDGGDPVLSRAGGGPRTSYQFISGPHAETNNGRRSRVDGPAPPMSSLLSIKEDDRDSPIIWFSVLLLTVVLS